MTMRALGPTERDPLPFDFRSRAVSDRSPSEAWKADVDLECWILSDRDPIVVEVDGTLSDATCSELLRVLAEVIANRHSALEIHTRRQTIPTPEANECLTKLLWKIRSSGVVCSWNGVTKGRM